MEYGKRKRIYILCVVIVLVGLVLFFRSVATSFIGLGNTLTEFVFPGEHTFEIGKKGTYSIYRQYRSSEGEQWKGYSAESIGAQIAVSVSVLTDERTVELKTPESSKRYSYMGKKGVKIFEFENVEPSSYRIESSYRDPSSAGSYTLALEHGFEVKRLKGIVYSQLLLLAPTLFAIILFMRTYIRG